MKTFWLFMLGWLATGVVYAQHYSRNETGITAEVNDITIEVKLYGADMVRIVKSPVGHIYTKQSLSVTALPDANGMNVQEENGAVVLRTGKMQVRLDLHTGKVEFSDPAGTSLLTEKDYGTQFSAQTGVDTPSYIVRQAFMLDKKEHIYGLGQQQNGHLDQRGQRIYLRQDNMKICIPFFQSTKGYGLFWDNYSPTHFTDNPQETAFESEVGDCSDYYFLFGGNGEGVIAKMRQLTGQAPLMPLWTYGFSQSRERYKTQFELLDIVKRYRALKVPLDGIIQDWQYWGKDSNWNAMAFDPATYPRPKEMVDSVHKLKAHLFIVAWPGFGPHTAQYEEFRNKHMLISFDTWPPNSGVKPYDPYNPQARDIYWSYLNKGIFQQDIDAWWLDSSEPDHINVKEKDYDQPTSLGSYRRVLNAFPLEHIRGVYEHQRSTTDAKRVVILTRSAFAGQQRYGSCNWSGDVVSDWKVFRKQIPAGLNLSLTGIPYWNTDIGGFFAGRFVKDGGAKNPAFQELYVRWMQFAAFTPLMRSHGTDIPREIFQFGNRGDWAFDVQEKFIRLRYSLLPYLYSTAWEVTNHAGSFMRALYLDFPGDAKVDTIDNEYMFGKAFLVCPVTQPGTSSQQVYLPANTLWHDFWTGNTVQGGQMVDRPAPIGILPLYVRAGSIIPLGPDVQYAEEKSWKDLSVRIYPGANGQFTLYEDEQNSYNYEKGARSEIGFEWDDQRRTLRIADRKGNFTGMSPVRKFDIAVGAKHKTVVYKGSSLEVRL